MSNISGAVGNVDSLETLRHRIMALAGTPPEMLNVVGQRQDFALV
jgi:hypothetical protein